MLSYNNNTENKLLKQLEYYFSDVNLGRDKFMRDRLREGLGCKLWFLNSSSYFNMSL